MSPETVRKRWRRDPRDVRAAASSRRLMACAHAAGGCRPSRSGTEPTWTQAFVSTTDFLSAHLPAGRGSGPQRFATAHPGGGLQTAPWGVRRATAGHVLAPAGHRGEHGGRSSSNEGGRRRGDGRDATAGSVAAGRPGQLAVRRRAPPPSNSSASASTPITGRAGTGVRSATMENCTAAALGLPLPSRAAPAAMSTVTVPEAAGRPGLASRRGGRASRTGWPAVKMAARRAPSSAGRSGPVGPHPSPPSFPLGPC